MIPISAARSVILNESGYLQDLKASSKAVDFSLSSPILFKMSAMVWFFLAQSEHNFVTGAGIFDGLRLVELKRHFFGSVLMVIKNEPLVQIFS